MTENADIRRKLGVDLVDAHRRSNERSPGTLNDAIRARNEKAAEFAKMVREKQTGVDPELLKGITIG
jgi:hypothetical protein